MKTIKTFENFQSNEEDKDYMMNLYNLAAKENAENLSEFDSHRLGFTFEKDGNRYDVVWDEDSLCAIIIENDEYDSAHEVDENDLENILGSL